MEKPEKKFELSEKFPSTLDIVKIDGRWGQVVARKIGSGSVTIRFLDDGTAERIDLSDYYLAHKFGVPVDSLIEDFGEGLSPTEKEKIYWGPEEKEHPRLKGQVTVFGEYKKPE